MFSFIFKSIRKNVNPEIKKKIPADVTAITIQV